MFRFLFLFIVSVFGLCNSSVFAQQINGVIQSRQGKLPLADAQLVNVHSGKVFFTDSSGNFKLEAHKGELIEIRLSGYLKTSFRLSMGNIPPFYKIYLDTLLMLNTDRFASSGFTQYQIDSVLNYELYHTTLNYPRMSTFEQIESPFTALSRSNQQKWKFQESYAMFEREKFIDFTFNEHIIREVTGLEGDDLKLYMSRFRPSYEQLRKMGQYDYYRYLRDTANRYRRSRAPSTPRNSG